MAKWSEQSSDSYTATAGELINLSVRKESQRVSFNAIQAEYGPKPTWVAMLNFGAGLTKELGPFKKLKQAKRAAEAEANRLIAAAMMDLNIEKQIQRGFKINR